MVRLPFMTSPPANPDGRMSVMDHLRELRRRLILVMIIVALGGIVAYNFYTPLLDVLKGPYCHVPPAHRLTDIHGGCDLVFRDPLGGFTVRLKVSVIGGAILTAPLWLYQVWAFVTPGLRKNERKWTLLFILSSTVLFIAGMALAFLTLRTGLNVLIGSAGGGVKAQLDVASYISFVVLVLVVFGASFELPLLIILLNAVRILPYSVLKRSQRIGIFLVFLFAAVATPSTDPFTMTAMAVPMVILFEASVLWAFFHDRRRARRQLAEHEELPDDVASTINPMPERLDDQLPRRTPERTGADGSDWTDLP